MTQWGRRGIGDVVRSQTGDGRACLEVRGDGLEK